MALYALILLTAGVIDGPRTVEITIGSDAGKVRETQGRVERTPPGFRPVEIIIGSDQGSPRESQTRVHRLR